jgi:hypothetical protein
MRAVIKIFISFILMLLLSAVLYINKAIYYKPTIQIIESDTINMDVLRQLRHLKHKMAAGAADDMQGLYPEGYIFMHTLYGLAWCDFASGLTPNSSLYKEAQEEISKSCVAVQLPKARAIFDENLTIPHGAFYAGWSSYLLGKKLSLEKASERNGEEVKYFQQQCAWIAEAFTNYTSPYPESYYQAAWPADAMVCAASLRLHDKIFAPQYSNVLYTWIDKVKKTFDTRGLIPHRTDPVTGQPREGARGSSQSLMLIFLHEIEPEFGKQQFDIYKNNFPDERLGLPGICEYPRGVIGAGDVDSGPVIFQMGAAASIVGIRTLATYHETSRACGIQGGIEAFGFSTHDEDEKEYIFGILPMADVFITWAQTAIPIEAYSKTIADRSRFHLYSAVVLIIIIASLIIQWRDKLWRKQA